MGKKKRTPAVDGNENQAMKNEPPQEKPTKREKIRSWDFFMEKSPLANLKPLENRTKDLLIWPS